VDFFADDASAIANAKLVCATCPVRVECLQFACDHGEIGIWGGATRRERREIRARRSFRLVTGVDDPVSGSRG
jgi:WhiB family redox-sensing transcriptional regulator